MRRGHERPKSPSTTDSTPTPNDARRSASPDGTELQGYSIRTQSFITPTTSRDPVTFLKALYSRKVGIHVAFRDHRNHLANERTFLAWFRTSVLLSMVGILTTQLFHLQPSKVRVFGVNFFMLGSPLGAVCHAAALLNILFGAHKFWRQQCAMVQGEALAGGWELLLAGILITMAGSRSLVRGSWLTWEQITLVFFIFILICDTDQPPR